MRLPTVGTTRKPGFLLRFFSETIAELKKVAWPSRQETMRLTIMVLIVSVVIGLFLGLVDYLFLVFFRLLL